MKRVFSSLFVSVLVLLLIGCSAGETTSETASERDTSADLSSLDVSSGTLSPAFSSAVTSYTLDVDYSVTSVDITPTALDANATITFIGAIIANGVPKTIPLSVGTTSVSFALLSADGVTQKTYDISITRAPMSYSVGGSVTGLNGSLTIQNNTTDNLTINANGAFTFGSFVLDKESYGVTIITQPTDQICYISNGSGTIDGSNINNISISCQASSYTVTGHILGLTGTIVLQNNASDDLILYANGAFAFSQNITTGDSYNVSIKTQPDGQTCSVSNAVGTIGGLVTFVSDGTDVIVSCENKVDIFVEPMDHSGYTNAIASGDLDGDGDLDQITAHFNNQCLVLINNGSGSLRNTQQNLNLIGTISSLALGDVDGDGDLDLLQGLNNHANQIWLNNGKGIFTNSNQVLGNSQTESVVFGDIDNDGDLDFIEGIYFTSDKVWFNDGKGNFSDTNQSLGAKNSNTSMTYSLALGDVDSDGDLDLVVGSALANSVWVNDGNGTFLGTTQYLGSTTSTNLTYSVELADLDGDGDLDLAQGNYNHPNEIWLNNGSGIFTNTGQTLGNAETRGINLADFDGDGDVDIIEGITNSEASASDVLWINDGSAVFSDSSLTFGNYQTRSISSSDLDGDGDIDIYNGNEFVDLVWLNNGTNPPTFTNTAQTLKELSATSSAMGDLDGDGDLDIVLGNGTSSAKSNTVWLNDGKGNYYDGNQTLGNGISTSVVLGDVDGDGDIDLIVGNTNAQSNTVWLNNADGNFTDSTQTLGTGNTESVALGDIDGDGDLDMVVGNFDEANTVWLNNGSGVFSDSGQTLGNDGTNVISLEDMDGDGDLDIIEANLATYSKIWLNDSNGNFTDTNKTFGSRLALSMSFGDIDNDGDIDIIEGTRVEAKDTIWVNDGNANVSNAKTLGDKYNTSSLKLRDLDGDGDLDLVVGIDSRDNPIWINDGTGNFFYSGQSLNGRYSSDVILGDIDGDNDLDLLNVASGDSTKVFINNYTP